MKLRGNKFDVRGDIIIRDELEALPNTKILYVHNLLKFTKTLMLRKEWSVYSADDCYGLIIRNKVFNFYKLLLNICLVYHSLQALYGLCHCSLQRVLLLSLRRQTR